MKLVKIDFFTFLCLGKSERNFLNSGKLKLNGILRNRHIHFVLTNGVSKDLFDSMRINFENRDVKIVGTINDPYSEIKSRTNLCMIFFQVYKQSQFFGFSKHKVGLTEWRSGRNKREPQSSKVNWSLTWITTSFFIRGNYRFDQESEPDRLLEQTLSRNKLKLF